MKHIYFLASLVLLFFATFPVVQAQQLDGWFGPVIKGGSTINQVSYVALQPDGKMLVAGTFTYVAGQPNATGLVRLHSNGTIDNTFSVGTGVNGTINSLALQANGKILVGGSFNRFDGKGRHGLVRLNGNGSLDPSFLTSFTADTYIYRIVVQADGKIILSGSVTQLTLNNSFSKLLLRLNGDGTLDNTFNTTTNTGVAELALQSDGKILVFSSYMSQLNGTTVKYIGRLNADGTTDDTFQLGTNLDGAINAAHVQADGKIVIAGNFTSIQGTTRYRVARLNANGTVDNTFSPGTLFSNFVPLHQILAQPDGKVVLCGPFFNVSGRNGIIRLNADGTVDNTFTTSIGPNRDIRSVTPLAGGKLLIGGNFTAYITTKTHLLALLGPDGNPDAGLTSPFETGGFIEAMAQQSNGKIVIGGAFTTINATAAPNIARLNADGTRDATFNPGNGPDGIVKAIAIQSDGKILVGGNFSVYNGVSKRGLVRLNPDGTIDNSFTAYIGAGVWAICIQGDGKVLIGGNFSTVQGVARKSLARLNADGTLDNTFDVGTGASTDVLAIVALPNGKIMAGGTFSTFNNTAVNGLVVLNGNGSLHGVVNFGTSVYAGIRTIVPLSDGKALVGGAFSNSSSALLPSHLVRIDAEGKVDSTFRMRERDLHVDAILPLPGGKILAGGNYNQVIFPANARPMDRTLVRLHNDGSLDYAYNTTSSVAQTVQSLLPLPGGGAYAGGAFTLAGPFTKTTLAKLLPADSSLISGLSARHDSSATSPYEVNTTIGWTELADNETSIEVQKLNAYSDQFMPVDTLEANATSFVTTLDRGKSHCFRVKLVTPQGAYYSASLWTIPPKFVQTIVFAPIADRPFNSGPFVVKATSNAGDYSSVQYEIVSGPATAFTKIANGVVTPTGTAGPVVVRAFHNGNLAFTPASAELTFCLTPPKPTVTPQGTSTSATFTLLSSSETANQWLRNGEPIAGATERTYNVTQAGTYAVRVSAGTCSATSEAITLTGAEAPKGAATVGSVFPNPVTDVLFVELPGSVSPSLTGIVYNLLGKRVASISFEPQAGRWQGSLNVARLPR